MNFLKVLEGFEKLKAKLQKNKITRKVFKIKEKIEISQKVQNFKTCSE